MVGSAVGFHFRLKWTHISKFKYFNFLFSVNKSFPNVALTPLTREVRGTRVQLFSPYYPCYTPAGEYTLTCRITPQRYVTFYRTRLFHGNYPITKLLTNRAKKGFVSVEEKIGVNPKKSQKITQILCSGGDFLSQDIDLI